MVLLGKEQKVFSKKVAPPKRTKLQKAAHPKIIGQYKLVLVIKKIWHKCGGEQESKGESGYDKNTF